MSEVKKEARKYLIRDDGRIVALRDFGAVKAGDVGGYVDGYHNLSHKGTCWVFDDALVSHRAVVSGAAQIRDNAIVTGHARVYGRSVIDRHAYILGTAKVVHQHVTGNTRIEASERKRRRSLDPVDRPNMSPVKNFLKPKTVTYEEVKNG